MSLTLEWLAALTTVAVLVLYEASLAVAQRRRPERVARSVHAALREEWFAAVSEQKGSEILAVQTLRNALMSASMIASTAALALMGTVTLAAPSLRIAMEGAQLQQSQFSPRLAMELVLLALLFASLVASVMSARYYNHASFVGGMPVGSEARTRWSGVGADYARKAGLLYGLGLRHLVLVAPVLAFILHPLAGPPMALLATGSLIGFDSIWREPR